MSNNEWEDLNEVHPELAEVMSKAQETATEAMAQGFIKDLLQVEEKMFDDFGNPEGSASTWVISLGEPGEYDEKTGDTKGDLNFTPVSSNGDVYKILRERKLFGRLMLSDAVGLIVRVGGKASASDDGEFPPQDVVITIMVNGSGLFTAVRLLEDDRVETEWVAADVIAANVAEGEKCPSITGKGRLADVAVSTYMAPAVIKDSRPEMARALVEMFKDDK
jgi:hypothetical protein